MHREDLEVSVYLSRGVKCNVCTEVNKAFKNDIAVGMPANIAWLDVPNVSTHIR